MTDCNAAAACTTGCASTSEGNRWSSAICRMARSSRDVPLATSGCQAHGTLVIWPLQGGRLMTEKIRVGIVGATVTQGGSGWGANAHVPALRALPGYELKAVCTAHEDTAKASAAAFGAELAFHR